MPNGFVLTMVTRRKESGEGLVVKYVRVSNCYMWRGAWVDKAAK